MRVAFAAFTRRGLELARRLAVRLAVESDRIGDEITLSAPSRIAEDEGVDSLGPVRTWAAERFGDSDALVFVGATGIAVRAIADQVGDKFSDPAVVALDERGKVVVPLLSGHLGGANALARELAGYTGGVAAVSTATDVEGVFAVDEWAEEHGLVLLERERDIARDISAAILEGEAVGYAVEPPRAGAGEHAAAPAPARGAGSRGRDGSPAPGLGVYVGLDAGARAFERTLHLVPRVVTVGVGCRRGVDPAVLEGHVRKLLEESRIAPEAVRAVASIDAKGDEPAVGALAVSLGCPAVFCTADELNDVEGEFPESEFVRAAVGTGNVCERAAAAGGGTLIVGKRKGDGVTAALAALRVEIPAPGGLAGADGRRRPRARGEALVPPRPAPAPRPGKLSVVGLGPGAGADLTLRARRALEDCDLIVGYGTYVDLVRGDFPEKPALTTGMRHEAERCRVALERAAQGEAAALVCSGDPGVYGMAGLCYELRARDRRLAGVEIEVVPGVTAASGGAALVGAPLGHDFAVISLSDLLTPWDVIERRLESAARADLVVCLYNPASRGRPEHLLRACEVLLRHRSPNTVCAVARDIGRAGEGHELMTLSSLRDFRADMSTTVFVGSSATRVIDGKMVTPRGYRADAVWPEGGGAR